MEPGAIACGCCEGIKLQKGVNGENPSSLLTGTGKSCLENWTGRLFWENLNTGARGGRKGRKTSRVFREVSTPPDFRFLHCALINVSVFKGSLLALMLVFQRAA